MDLKLKEDISGQIILSCEEEITNCPENVLSIMKKGNKNTIIGETNIKNAAGVLPYSRFYQVSPSTPKDTLLQYISTITNDYEELLEYTTLEKQLLCHENHCCVHEDEVRKKAEYNTEVKERLERLNLAGECNIDRIITELCDKLDEAEAKSRQEMDSNKKKVKQLGELQKQIENITSDKDKFEYISRELRAQLKAKTTEFEKQVECVVSEKEKLERVNAELRSESTKKLAELQKQIEYVTSERDEFQHMRHELRVQLNKTSLELEKLKNDPESVREELIADIKELERQIEDVTSEKSKLERVNAELNDRVLEVEAMTVERHQFECVNTELDHVASELKLKIVIVRI